MSSSAIKSMKLYSQVDRIYNDLANIGIGKDDPLNVDVLSPFDQYHYFGTRAVDEAIAAAGIGENSHVLDVGSGLGGPARWLAHRTGCYVTAVELQADLNDTATALTWRCGLAGNIDHVCGNILSTLLDAGAYDAVVSWLALYHIPDRAPLFPLLNNALRPGGKIYVEDLYQLAPFSAGERVDLETMLYGNTIPERDAYIAELADAGFGDVGFEDMTESWKAFTVDRLAAFRAARAVYARVHSEDMFEALEAFYSSVARLFAGGHMGGVRLTAAKG
ncbi:MAG: SAM-dependent methyltransferase [Hyphomicrobiaceae bacterium]